MRILYLNTTLLFNINNMSGYMSKSIPLSMSKSIPLSMSKSIALSMSKSITESTSGPRSGSMTESTSGYTSGSIVENTTDSDSDTGTRSSGLSILFLCWIGLVLIVLIIPFIHFSMVILYQTCIKPSVQNCYRCITNSWYNCITNFKIIYNNCFKKHFKIRVIPKNINDENINDQCTICLDENITHTRTLNCNHRYHITCLDKWAEECRRKNYNISCPMCRAIIV